MPRFFHDLTVNAFVHATEDNSKVTRALENLLGEPPDGYMEELSAEGIHNNPISNLVVSYKRERDIKRIISRWCTLGFWREAIDQVEERLDDGQVFHIRIDKQRAFEEELVLFSCGEPISIKLKIATYPRSRKEALDVLSRIPDL